MVRVRGPLYKLLKEGYVRDYVGTTVGDMKGEARSIDYYSQRVFRGAIIFARPALLKHPNWNNEPNIGAEII